MEKVGFYPGCSLKGSSREYGESVVELAKALEMPLEELKDWNCCGASSAHAVDKKLSVALPARILALATAQGFKEVVVPCAACYNRLVSTQHTISKDFALKDEVEKIIKMTIADVKVLNVMQWLEKYAAPVLAGKIKTPMNKKVACYYGCLLVRPTSVINGDRVEDPQSMDILAKAAGATPIDWAFKTECCGGGFSVSRTNTVARLSADVLTDAVSRGAEIVIVACPMCHSNLDMRRDVINTKMEQKTDIPVIYLTQLLGMAVGLTAEQVGVERHFVNYKEETICQK
ncbi:MAG: CoB--CoM heterodisulfide reductase iron-sulfur subunit B family protein [Flavobacteriales bacterium]|nr:CoB--CoM heterodisulfide reductase iron-sulfur subunit B family protein [Flavobacteriales bacterium]